MMWNAVRKTIETRGGAVQLKSEVIAIRRKGNRIESVLLSRDGKEVVVKGTHFISSMPIPEFLKKLEPAPPPAVQTAALNLKHRDFLTVCLIYDRPQLFEDNWIYIHDPGVKVGRVQNFKNWSPDMVPDLSKTSLGLEYFCNAGDELWSMSDADLIALGKKEMEQIGLAPAAAVVDGCVFRMRHSYPVYDSDYRTYLATIREYVDNLENFQTIGRNGLHRYNNQDHAMLTGMLAVRNMLHGETNDLWSVNTDQEYHEEVQQKPEQTTDSVKKPPQAAKPQARTKTRESSGLASTAR
jgi:protoporphyrinogen oxidase